MAGLKYIAVEGWLLFAVQVKFVFLKVVTVFNHALDHQIVVDVIAFLILPLARGHHGGKSVRATDAHCAELGGIGCVVFGVVLAHNIGYLGKILNIQSVPLVVPDLVQLLVNSLKGVTFGGLHLVLVLAILELFLFWVPESAPAEPLLLDPLLVLLKRVIFSLLLLHQICVALRCVLSLGPALPVVRLPICIVKLGGVLNA
jgi:hypothetical protein